MKPEKPFSFLSYEKIRKKGKPATEHVCGLSGLEDSPLPALICITFYFEGSGSAYRNVHIIKIDIFFHPLNNELDVNPELVFRQFIYEGAKEC